MDDAWLDAYLARIGVARAEATLETITWGHVTSIPFENLDILLGRPIRIDLPSIVDKLVLGRRGGYCFEQNTLLAAALERLGHRVTPLAARVRWLATGPMPRTHMLLRVDDRWLVDCGFGGACPTGPIPFEAGAEVALHLDRYRLIDEPDGLLLQMQIKASVPREPFRTASAGAPPGEAIDGAWTDLYGFGLEPQLPIDFEVANHYTSTHPQSRFVLGPVAALTRDGGRVTVRGLEVSRRRGGAVEREPIADGEQMLAVLRDELGLDFPAGTRFRGGPR